MDGDLQKQLRSYKGNDAYVFVCYSHQDADTVYDDMQELNSKGINLWYDEGISAGSAWRGEIATAIKGANKFIFFISETSLNSSHCLREVDYALSHEIEIIPVYLEECGLPAELDLVLNRVHALFRNKDARFLEHLLEALQEKRRPGAILPASRKRKSALHLPVLLIGLTVALLVVWQVWDSNRIAGPSKPDTVTTAGANDRYLEGLELLVRWDKDDNLDTAIDLFREATTIDPGFALAYARLASALRLRYAITRNDSWLDEAVENANKAVGLNPDLAPVQVALGRVQTTLGNYDLAFAAIERALAIDPNDAEAHLAIAKVYERQGRLQDAEDSFKRALAFDQDSLLIRDSYANFLFRQSRFDEAAAQWRSVILIAPNHFGALVNLGSALSEIGNIPEAISMYEQAISIKPTYMAWSNLGTAYAREQHYPQAVDAFRKALEMNDSDSLAWGNLAYVYSWMNEMDDQASETFEHAIELAEEARQQNPRDPYIHSDLALYYAKQGQPELAQRRLDTALALSPDSGDIQATAAEVYELIGQRDKAVERVQKALELGYQMQRFRQSPEFVRLLTDPRMQN
jgi:tetratricopeptide (TPR) repeat protein